MDKRESLRLAELAQQGDAAAFEALVTAHEKMVYNLVYRMVGNTEDAQDISQEVFLKAYRYLARFNRQASFSTWIYQIAVNTAIDELRRRKGKETLSLEEEYEGDKKNFHKQYASPGPNVEEQVLEKEGLHSLKQAVFALPEEQKTVVILRDMEGFSYEEIARITGTALGTVKSRLARGREQLRRWLLAEKETGRTSIERRGRHGLF